MDEALGHDELALLYGSGELEPAARERFEAHLPGCPPCRLTLAALGDAARLAGAARLAPARALTEAVAARLGWGEERAAVWGWTDRARAAGLGAGLVLGAALLLALPRSAPRTLPAGRALDAELGELGARVSRLDAALSRDAWDIEFEQTWNDLSRRRATLERQLAKPEGA